MKKLLAISPLAILLLLLFAGCSKIGIIVNKFTSEKEMTAFSIIAGLDTIKMNILDSTIEGITPNNNVGKDSMVAIFSFKGRKVHIAGVPQVSAQSINNFKNSIAYVVEAEDGSMKSYKVKLRLFTGLPIVYITSPNITSKDNYVNGKMVIDGNVDYASQSYSIQIKGRGNSTWGNPKNPYKIKLVDKAVILGMPADKEWALLASYFDKSLLRNDLEFELSERMQLAWTPKRRLVEVFLNGGYNGNYLLTETVKTGADRLNISLMEDKKSSTDTIGSFLVEADFRMEAVQTWVTNSEVRLSMKEPALISPVQFEYVTRTFQSLEDDISNYRDIRSKIDLDSWIRWVIVNEVMRNRDAPLYGNCFFYKDRTGKIAAGPVWDADLSAGSYAGNVPEGWYVNTANWIGGLFYYHPYYKERFKEIWNENKVKITSITQYLDSQERTLRYSQVKNYQKWDTMESVLFDGQLVYPTYAEEIKALRTWLTKRINWMDTEINR
ncbi:MAG: CotH kinase family protein [Chitinophagaceae bacterium]